MRAIPCDSVRDADARLHHHAGEPFRSILCPLREAAGRVPSMMRARSRRGQTLERGGTGRFPSCAACQHSGCPPPDTGDDPRLPARVDPPSVRDGLFGFQGQLEVDGPANELRHGLPPPAGDDADIVKGFIIELQGDGGFALKSHGLSPRYLGPPRGGDAPIITCRRAGVKLCRLSVALHTKRPRRFGGAPRSGVFSPGPLVSPPPVQPHKVWTVHLFLSRWLRPARCRSIARLRIRSLG